LQAQIYVIWSSWFAQVELLWAPDDDTQYFESVWYFYLGMLQDPKLGFHKFRFLIYSYANTGVGLTKSNPTYNT
jgi:hypothetical protein